MPGCSSSLARIRRQVDSMSSICAESSGSAMRSLAARISSSWARASRMRASTSVLPDCGARSTSITRSGKRFFPAAKAATPTPAAIT